MRCPNVARRHWRAWSLSGFVALTPGACCQPNQAPVVPALEVIVLDGVTGGAPSSDVVVRATLRNLPAFEVTLSAPRVIEYVSGSGPGTYQVEVTAEGYQDWTRSVEVGGRCMDTQMETVIVYLTRADGGPV